MHTCALMLVPSSLHIKLIFHSGLLGKPNIHPFCIAGNVCILVSHVLAPQEESASQERKLGRRLM